MTQDELKLVFDALKQCTTYAFAGGLGVRATAHTDALAILEKALAQPEQNIAALVEGMEVSIDVSTGDHDSGNRLFGVVDLVQENQGSKHGLILLVQEPEANFKEALAQPEQESVLIDGVAYTIPSKVAAEILGLHLDLLQLKQEQEPVQDDHQAFIDSLPTDGNDKMFMQIDHWARESYKRHQSSVRGQAVTAADAYDSHIVWAVLRWAKENTPPQPEQEPVAWMYELIIDGEVCNVECTNVNWNPEYQPFGRAGIDFVEGGKVTKTPIYTAPPQHTWVGLTVEEIAACCMESTTTQLSFYNAIEAKLKEKNT
jgi:hypothetical protein